MICAAESATGRASGDVYLVHGAAPGSKYSTTDGSNERGATAVGHGVWRD